MDVEDDVFINKSFATVLNDEFSLNITFIDIWDDIFKYLFLLLIMYNKCIIIYKGLNFKKNVGIFYFSFIFQFLF